MKACPHLVVDLSAHGYGHLSLMAPVLAELVLRIPDLRLTIRSALPEERLRARVAHPFAHVARALDFGMVMRSPTEVDLAKSAAAYEALHADLDARVAEEARELTALAPDLLVSCIPYLSLLAAARAGVAAASLCSLDWAHIYGPLLGGSPAGDRIQRDMLRAYASALFIRPEPSMPMPGLGASVDVGPIAAVTSSRRAELDLRLGLAPGERLVLVALGGIPSRIPIEAWPRSPGVRWLVPEEWRPSRPDAVPLESLGLPFPALLASCDAAVAKPGYGTFAEAAVAGVPLLVVPRDGWPEAAALVEWIERRGRALRLAPGQLERGDLREALDELLALPQRAPPVPSGASEAAGILAKLLASTSPRGSSGA